MKKMSLVFWRMWQKDLKSKNQLFQNQFLIVVEQDSILHFLETALWMLKGSSYLWEDKKDGRESNEEVVKLLALCSQKGGVGKTTSCVNLAVGLAKAGEESACD